MKNGINQTSGIELIPPQLVKIFQKFFFFLSCHLSKSQTKANLSPATDLSVWFHEMLISTFVRSLGPTVLLSSQDKFLERVSKCLGWLFMFTDSFCHCCELLVRITAYIYIRFMFLYLITHSRLLLTLTLCQTFCKHLPSFFIFLSHDLSNQQICTFLYKQVS